MVTNEDFELEADSPKLRKLREKQLNQAAREVEDLRKVLSTQEGRRLIWRYIQLAPPHEQSAVQSGSFTYLNEGARKITSAIYKEIWANFPDAYLLMSNEAKDENNGN